jgi:hypothetical protein
LFKGTSQAKNSIKVHHLIAEKITKCGKPLVDTEFV